MDESQTWLPNLDVDAHPDDGVIEYANRASKADAVAVVISDDPVFAAPVKSEKKAKAEVEIKAEAEAIVDGFMAEPEMLDLDAPAPSGEIVEAETADGGDVLSDEAKAKRRARDKARRAKNKS
jgi:hypothetical protein